VSDRQFEYEVAFSFLGQDEPLVAKVNDLLQDRVKTFFYPERQREIAGTDGEQTFNKVFSEEARMIAVFYRKGWGDTTWTRIEQTAIRNRAAEEGYDFAKFIPLDEPPEVPKWLPKTQIWIGLKRYGIESAAAVIEDRIQQLGGRTHEETVEEHAQRTERKMLFDDLREKFQWDIGVKAALQEVAKLKNLLEERALTVRNASPLIPLSITEESNTVYIVGLGRALGMQWRQQSGNHLQNSFLRATLFSQEPAGAGYFYYEKPEILRKMQFRFDLLPTEVGGWISDDTRSRTFSTDALADYLMKFYLEHGRG
jgi:hypothetical protein